MKTITSILAIIGCTLMLQGCVYKLVTVPVGIAYKTTKGVVKGTAAVVEAVIPDGDDDDKKEKESKE
ncbi:NF038104 family lipoprotein [Acinetobacter nosocomialis]|uniref:NF038104 family lipoprotein n=1 Tax=Acinetobacter nosocomialis TaxID=106654 RepID=UPI00124D2EF2|nr:NF038104 family lipoprotein [Acinetobacter nosocomialis]MDO7537897.1 NF038104 family lipoprotein [Acinetobacter nosocomialis]